MNKIEKVFTDFINEGGIAAKRITDPDKKAMAYAALAQAIAHSGLMIERTYLTAEGIAPVEEITPETVEEVQPEETGKNSLKESASKGTGAKKTSAKKTTKKEETVPVEEETTPEPVEETQPEETVDHPGVDATHVEDTQGLEEEWSEEMQELKAEQLETLNAYIDAWTEDFVCRECLGNFFEDTSIKADQLWDYIRPTNIDGFIAYLESLSE